MLLVFGATNREAMVLLIDARALLLVFGATNREAMVLLIDARAVMLVCDVGWGCPFDV